MNVGASTSAMFDSGDQTIDCCRLWIGNIDHKATEYVYQIVLNTQKSLNI